MTTRVPKRDKVPGIRAIRKQSWVCYAKPAALNGDICTHVNPDGGMKHGHHIVCGGCGCTKIASDARLEKISRQQQAKGRA